MSCSRCRNSQLGLVFPSGRGLFHYMCNISHGIHQRSTIQTLNRPKNRSGANLVCPTNMNKSSTVSLRPVITLHTNYCMTMLLLFWPTQLSACSCRFFSFRPWFCKNGEQGLLWHQLLFSHHWLHLLSNLLVLMLAHKIRQIY